MAQRTTDALVKEAMEPGGDYNTRRNPSLARPIKLATLLVDRVVACAEAKDEAMTTEEATEMETYLAAHYYCMSDQTLASKSTNGASGSFHGQTGKGLEATKYGQNALDIDFSGCLRAITSNKRASTTWLGVTDAEALDYDDRN